jgi:2-polyprenyl-3-methyl-5-hydroxy-6-metoxy-1,4-benzoquinol methylase
LSKPGKTPALLKQPDYSAYARFYDYFELAGHEESGELNVFLDELFKLNKVSSVVDFACGTGAQSTGLARVGYKVTASDLNPAMLKIAARKAGKMKIGFVAADMRTCSLGTFDAAICIFNAIGHLSRDDCRLFFANACKQLNPGGLFVVDILNFTAMAAGVFKEYKYMSREAIVDGMLVHHVRNCTLSKVKRQIRVKSVTRWQDGFNPPAEIHEDWQMQIYDADELRQMLYEAGFTEINLFGLTGTEFSAETTDSILAVCQK